MEEDPSHDEECLRIDRELDEIFFLMQDYIREGEPKRALKAKQQLDHVLPADRFPSLDVFEGCYPDVANHMTQYLIECRGWGGQAPLEMLASLIPGTYYYAPKFHAAVHFPDWNHASAVLVCKTWKIIVTGGATLQDGQRSARGFLHELSWAMRTRLGDRNVHVHAICGIPKNRMCPHKVYSYYIDIVSLYDACTSSLGVVAKCVQGQIHNLTITPFPRLFPSLSIILYPEGGVNVMGFVYDQELELAREFIRRLLPPFLRFRGHVDLATRLALRDKSKREREVIRYRKRECKKAYWAKITAFPLDENRGGSAPVRPSPPPIDIPPSSYEEIFGSDSSDSDDDIAWG